MYICMLSVGDASRLLPNAYQIRIIFRTVTYASFHDMTMQSNLLGAGTVDNQDELNYKQKRDIITDFSYQ